MISHVSQSVIGGVWLGVATLFAALTLANEPAPPANAVQPSPNASVANSPPVASPAEIAAWIVELEDYRYVVREQASRRLLAAGIPALDPLLAAANGDGMEGADRAIDILRRFSAAKDPLFRRQALERLAGVKGRPRISAAAGQALAMLRHQDAVAALEKLGARFTSTQFNVGQGGTGPYQTFQVILDKQWRGGDTGLVHLPDLLGLQYVVIVGTDVSLDGLAQLKNVPALNRVQLYGTNLEQDDVAKVSEMLPRVEIDYRRGGLLGVGSNTPDAMGPPVVGTVQKNSVAAAAGIQVGDVIQQFNGQPVATFRELTKKIGELRAGDEVRLEVVREGKPISFAIKLGQWETI